MSADRNDVLVQGLKAEDVEEALRDYIAKKGLDLDIVQKSLAPHEKPKDGGIKGGKESKRGGSKDEVEHKSGEDGNETDKVQLFDGAYSKLLKSKEHEVSVMEKNATKAMASVQTFHAQQKQLFDEFVLLRQRYDEVKQNLSDTLWGGCCEFHPDLKVIPEKKEEGKYLETDDRLGAYNLGHMLGEGQFATVKSCSVSKSRAAEYADVGDSSMDPGKEYAMKIIDKDKIQSLHSLKRMSNEITILYELRSPYIVCVTDVIQTGRCLYIVTEKGGEDLFEFFDEHPDGVPEDWARKIMAKILKGVYYCHLNLVCHRDLKPENILVSFNVESGECEDLKLCDFGLAAHFSHGTRFSDFCGSPGFFAPEMIISGTYFGDKADIWSCGCILLELVLGHEQFCEVWMNAYDYEVLQEKQQFIREIDSTVERLAANLDFSNALNDFVLTFLHLRASERPDISKIITHEWLDLSADEKAELETVRKEAVIANKTRRKTKKKEDSLRSILFDKSRNSSRNSDGFAGLTLDIPGLDSPPGELEDDGEGGRERTNSNMSGGGTSDLSGTGGPSASGGRRVVNRGDRASSLNDLTKDQGEITNFTDPKIVQKAYEQMSAKERKLYDQYNIDHDKNKKDLALPPIEPQTPNVGMARKILLRGADLAKKVSNTQKGEGLALETPSNSPMNSHLVSPLTQTPKSNRQGRPLVESPDSKQMQGSSSESQLVGHLGVGTPIATDPQLLSPSPVSHSIGKGENHSNVPIGSPLSSGKLAAVSEDITMESPGISRPTSKQAD